MNIEYFIDEGHKFDREDFTEYVKWKINDLKNNGYSKSEIFYFEENKLWNNQVTKLLGKID